MLLDYFMWLLQTNPSRRAPAARQAQAERNEEGGARLLAETMCRVCDVSAIEHLRPTTVLDGFWFRVLCFVWHFEEW